MDADKSDEGDSPDGESIADRVDELEATVNKMLPDRRGVLKGLGAAAVGGAAVSGATGGASGQSAAGQIGTSQSPVDVEAADVNAGSVSTAYASHSGSNPLTLYVRSSGDDTNTGLSESDAVASVSQAIKNVSALPIPKDGGQETVQIDIEGGSTFLESETLMVDLPWVSEIKIQSSDSNQSTIECDTTGDGVVVKHTWLSADNIRFTDGPNNQPGTMVKVSRATFVPGSGCKVEGATDHQIYAQEQSLVSLTGDATVEGPDQEKSNFGVVGHSNSYIQPSPDTKITNCWVGINILEASTAGLAGDVDNCYIGVRIADNSNSKLDGITLSDCDIGVDIKRNSSARIGDTATFNNVADRIQRDKDAIIYDDGQYTGSLVLGPDGCRVEFGTVNVDVPAADDDGWDTNAQASKEVLFDDGFNTPPTIFFQSESGLAIPHPNNIQTGKFDIQVRNFTTSSFPNDYYWLAIGE